MARRRRRSVWPALAGALGLGAAAGMIWWLWQATRPVLGPVGGTPAAARTAPRGDEIDAAERRQLEHILRERAPARAPAAGR